MGNAQNLISYMQTVFNAIRKDWNLTRKNFQELLVFIKKILPLNFFTRVIANDSD